jgi:hypothetical protein
VEETGGPGENHQHVASHWQTLSHNVVHLALIEIRTHNISGDRLQSPGHQDQLLHDYVSSCEPFTIYSLIKCAYLCQKPGEIISN